MGILVFVENNGKIVPKSGLIAVGAALAAKSAHGYERVTALLCGGDGVEEAAKTAALSGVDEVIYVKSPLLEHYLSLSYAAAVKAILEQVPTKLFVLAATSQGKDLAPRISHSLRAGQASDIIAILPGGAFRRLMYAGNVVADVELLSEKKVITVRTSVFEAAALGSQACPVREISLNLTADNRQAYISFDTVKSERPDLQEARIVVSGGRAMKSSENFEKYLAPLADALGAAIGASRAAVDSGYAPNDWQVGQTGKVVAPQLYLAVGISGAIQHLAGMKDSKVIVAINKDPEAPIFEIADYGLVADLFEAVPELTEAIKRAKAA